jgi:hypothetical protein
MAGASATQAAGAGWRCPRCGRVFRRTRQQHSCRTVRLEDHVGPGDAMRPVFEELLARVRREIGAADVVSLPCCIHLCGTHDFLAVLPRKARLEIRFSLRREVESRRITHATRISSAKHKHSTDIATVEDIDDELLGWLREAYHLEDPSPLPGP